MDDLRANAQPGSSDNGRGVSEAAAQARRSLEELYLDEIARADARALRAETLLAEARAVHQQAHRHALDQIAATRATLSWRVTAPLRVARFALRGHIGAALIEAGVPRERIQRLADVAGEGGSLTRAWRALRHGLPGTSDLAVQATGPTPESPLAVQQAAHAERPATRIVHQFHSGSAEGDAITNAMYLIQKLLRGCGYQSDIFVEFRPKALEKCVFLFEDLRQRAEDYVLIVHHSMGFGICEQVATLPGGKILIYHNITPIEFLKDFPRSIPVAKLGREQLSLMRPHMSAALGDSEVNARELRERGYRDPVACPLLFDIEDMIARGRDRRPRPADVPFTILFVGRIVSSKAQAELVDAFAEFSHNWGKPCRLVIVGKHDPDNDSYPRDVRRRIAAHGLDESVQLTGPIPDAQLWECYRSADLYVSLSYHEGFGVPLIESMAFGVPVVAWPAGAVADTLGGAALLLNTRDPRAVGGIMLELARDPARRAEMIAKQDRVLDRFRLPHHLPVLIDAIVKAGAAPPSSV